MNAPKIRPGRAADWSALPALEESADEAFRDIPGYKGLCDGPNLTDGLTPTTYPDASLLVAESETLVGFAYGYGVGRVRLLAQIATRQSDQRQGVGTALLSAFIAAARRDGFTGVVLTTFAHIPWNAPYYRRHGFQDFQPSQLGSEVAAHWHQDQAQFARFGKRRLMGRFF